MLIQGTQVFGKTLYDMLNLRYGLKKNLKN
jgi:hypothetical protein